jgi:hypothetical protein
MDYSNFEEKKKTFSENFILLFILFVKLTIINTIDFAS